jgi:hypothetical protein
VSARSATAPPTTSAIAAAITSQTRLRGIERAPFAGGGTLNGGGVAEGR